MWAAAAGIAQAAGAVPLRDTISLNLVVSRIPVPELSATIMRDEVERIWAHEGVAITWRASEDQVPPDGRFIRLTLVDDVNRPLRKPVNYVLGDFLSDEGRIRVSLFAATRAAKEGTTALRRPRNTFEYSRALGYVLARAIAHEIGHALLGREHTETGLMSAAFPSSAMADPASHRFQLDAGSAARLVSSDARLQVKHTTPVRRAKAEYSTSGGH